jgi:hypothetical protein
LLDWALIGQSGVYGNLQRSSVFRGDPLEELGCVQDAGFAEPEVFSHLQVTDDFLGGQIPLPNANFGGSLQLDVAPVGAAQQD